MKTVLSLPLLILALAAVGPAAAQPKLYRWVDAEGKVHYSDSLPPEAIDQARRELSKESGMTTARIERAMTPEELAAIENERERAQAAEAAAQARRERDRILFNSYPTEAELERAFGSRLTMLDEAIRSAQIGIEAQQGVLASLLNDAADRELAGERIDPKVLESVREAYRQEETLRTALSRREAEYAATRQEFQATLEHYRELVEAAAARRN